jgi:outer membrane protein assembly factor BamB
MKARRQRAILLAAGLMLMTVAPVPGADLTNAWNLTAGVYVDSCPAIDAKGVVYVTASGSTKFHDVKGGELVAIDPDGKQKWAFTTERDIKSSPAIGADGTAYFGCRDRKLYAISADGKQKWVFGTGAWVDSSPAIALNGTVYFGSWDGNFYAVGPDGTKKWQFATGGVVDSSPAIGTDGVIYFGSHDGKFYALNPDGTRKWALTTGGAIVSSPAIGGDGTIFITSVDGRLYAVNADGSVKWKLWTGGVGESSPVVDGDGNIYVGVNNTMVAVGPDGKQKWAFGYPDIRGSAAVASDGTVYFAGTDSGVGILYAWDAATCTRKTSEELNGLVTGSPAVGADGTVYIGTGASVCAAIKGAAGLARGGWPKFRGNAMQNGRAGGN